MPSEKDISPVPVAGKWYRVVITDTHSTEDWLSKIAGIAYGDIYAWPQIWEANKPMTSGNPNVIFNGELIFIPERKPQKKKDLPDKKFDEFTLIIEGIEMPVSVAKITRTMDTCADAWTASVPWSPGENIDVDNALLPFRYPKSSAYLGGQLLVNGYTYVVTPEIIKTGIQKHLEGASFTADLVDSSCSQPYEKSNITLFDRCKQQLEGMNIDVIDEAQTEGVFWRACATPEETKFKHLSSLAAQRSAILSNTKQGDLLITTAKIDSKPVATIEEGQPGFENFVSTFNGRELFHMYFTHGHSRKKGVKLNGQAVDDNVPLSRQIRINSYDSDKGDINNIAEYKKNQEYVKALSISIPTPTWYSDESKKILWEVNTIVTVKSKTLSIPDGFDFLIRQIDYEFVNHGMMSTLHLIPPQAYSNKPMILPWGNNANIPKILPDALPVVV